MQVASYKVEGPQFEVRGFELQVEYTFGPGTPRGVYLVIEARETSEQRHSSGSTFRGPLTLKNIQR